MGQLDPNLIRQVVEQVLTQLASAQPGDGVATPNAASIHPPAGVCTGDYSKYTDRPDLARGGTWSPTQQTPPPSHPVTPGAPQGVVLTGIVTAEQLQQALKQGSPVKLAADARLTPLANDLARELPKPLERLAVGAMSGAASQGSAAGRWLWWADDFCPHLSTLSQTHRAALQPSASPRSEAGLAQTIDELERMVSRGELTGGVLFTRRRALTACLANKRSSLRAAYASSVPCVEAAMADIALNVLIIDHHAVNPQTMDAMLHRFTAQRPALPPYWAARLGG